MCTDDKSFAIRGVQDCLKRGYKRTGFFEVDTGESASGPSASPILRSEAKRNET